MKRIFALASIVAAVGCGSIVDKFHNDADTDSSDAAGDVYLPDSSTDIAPDGDDILTDSDLDSIVDDDSTDMSTDDSAICDSGALNFINQQGIEYNLGDVLLNGDGSFEATSARGWYRNSSALDEYNVAAGDYVVFSRETPSSPDMTGVTRILEYIGYDSTYNLVQFRDLGTGATITSTVTNDGSYDVFRVNVGGYSFNGAVDVTTGRISPIVDGGDTADGSEAMFHTEDGAFTIEELVCPGADE